MTKRLQINVDLTEYPDLYKDMLEIVRRHDVDRSKLLRIALRDKVDEIKKENRIVIKSESKSPSKTM